MENQDYGKSKEEILESIRKKIIFREYKPGEKLGENQLSDEFSVSRTPIREILTKLSSENLIELIPNKGAYVSQINVEKLGDVFLFRTYLIRLAGKLIAERITEKEIATLKSHLENMEGISDQRKLIWFDWRTHELLNKTTKSEFLQDSLRRLRNYTIRIELFPEENETFYDSFSKDFKELLDKLEKNDAEGAQELLVDHIRGYAKVVRENFIPEDLAPESNVNDFDF